MDYPIAGLSTPIDCPPMFNPRHSPHPPAEPLSAQKQPLVQPSLACDSLLFFETRRSIFWKLCFLLTSPARHSYLGHMSTPCTEMAGLSRPLLAFQDPMCTARASLMRIPRVCGPAPPWVQPYCVCGNMADPAC